MATRHISGLVAFMLLAGLLCGPAAAQQLMIYPSMGQGPGQQEQDHYECHNWAVQQSGFDPSTAQMAQAPMPAPRYSDPYAPQGDVLRGAGRGAALGAIGGAIGGNAGRGAAIGAATGALFGAFRRHDRRRREAAEQQAHQEQLAWEQQQRQSSVSAGQNAYNRAMSACLQGRGYTVS